MIVENVRRMFAGVTFDGVHPRDPVIAKILGLGRESQAGVSVTHDRVAAIPAVKRAAQIITDKIFGMPWYVFREEADGREYEKGHPAWRCITTQANPDLDDASLRQQLTLWALLYGNGCAYIDRKDAMGGAFELLPLPPDKTRIVRLQRHHAEAIGQPDMTGRIFYETRIDGEPKLFARSDVLHIRGLGPNPHWGWDICTLLMETFGGTIAKEEYSNRFFGQGATPAGFIEMTGALDEESEETYIDSLKKAMHGLGKAHKIILLEEGSKFQPVTIDPQKSQMLEGRQFDVRLMAMTLGIKVHKLIDGANSAFASLEQANQEHKDDDIMPWVNKWRKEYNTKLLSETEVADGSHSIDVDDEYLEWVPFTERASGVVELYNNGIIDKDDARRKVNYGPSRAARAKQFRIPANIVYEDDMALVGVDDNSPDAPPPADDNPPGDDGQPDESEDADEDEDSQAARRVAEAVTAAYVAKIETRLKKTARDKAKRSGKQFLAWLDALQTESGPAEIQHRIDGTYRDFRDRLNEIANTATSDIQLRSMIDAL